MIVEEEITQIYQRLVTFSENIHSITKVLDQTIERVKKLEAAKQ